MAKGETRMRKLVIMAVIVLAFTDLTQASVVVVKYDFGTYGNETLAPSETVAHITGGSFGYIGDGTTGFTDYSGNGEAYQAYGGWPDSVYADYFYFDVTIESGWKIDLDDISVEFDASTTNMSGPDSAKVTYLGNPETIINDNLEIGGSSWFGYGTYLAHPPTGLTGVVEFRIYGKGATANGSFSIDNVILNGTVSQIPEPATMCLLVGLGGLALLRNRKFR